MARLNQWRKGLRTAGGIMGAIFATTAIAAPAGGPTAAPVVPGYEVLRDSGKIDAAFQGELLLSELNCAACHGTGPNSRITKRPAPDLTEVGGRVTPQYLREFINDPHATKPGTPMPDLFHGMGDDARRQTVDELVHFLVSQGGPIAHPDGAATDVLLKQGEELFHTIGCVACHAPQTAATPMPAPPPPAAAPAKNPAKNPKNNPPAVPPNTASHAPPAGKPPLTAQTREPAKVTSVPLGNLAEKTTVSALAAFLLNPAHARPSGRMPSLNLTAGEAQAIAVYLLRDQIVTGPAANEPVPGSGVSFSYYEAALKTAAPEKLAALQPKSNGTIKNFTLDLPGTKKNKNAFAVKYDGWLWVPRDGKYTFTTKSDDGSFLLINSKVVVAHDGIHPPTEKSGTIDLKEGPVPIEVTYFQNGGGAELEVTWHGPGVKKQAIPAEALGSNGGKAMHPLKSEPFTPDQAKATRGRQQFATLGCVACHNVPNLPTAKTAKAMAALNADNPAGCLGHTAGQGVPRFDLSDDQRQAIAAALKNATAFDSPLEPAKQVVRMMASMNCFGCHVRDGIGGVGPDRNDYFKIGGNFDAGDEGRLPPRLSNVGAKLKPPAIGQIVHENQLHVRWYMATRMPQFIREPLNGLGDALAAADPVTQPADPAGTPVPQVTPGGERAGRQLVGVRGLGCVNCHSVNGVASLGAPAPDLSTAFERLRPEWFRRLLADPAKMNPGTRMPAFFTDNQVAFPDLAGGTFDGQVSAVWSYLRQGTEMALPDGLRINGSDEIVPADETVVMRAFVTGVGPRGILVGNPELVHCVFDANVVRLAQAWHGRFFDAKGIWESRGGTAAPPLGKDVIDLPAGPAFAVLESQAQEWPTPKGPFDRNLGGKFIGYTLDEKQRPTFKYELAGVEVQEKPVPKAAGERASLERQFNLSAKGPVKDLYFLVAAGKKIESQGPGVWRVDGKVTVKLTGRNGAAAGAAVPQTQLRDGKDGTTEVLMPVDLNGNAAAFSMEISW